MFSKFRKCAVTLGAAALVSAQAVHAAPAQPAPAVDPLVAVSLLGTSQSRAAVCGTGAACTFPAASVSPIVATAASAAATQDLPGPRESKGTFWILFLGGGMVLIAILVALLAGNDENNPVSPD